MDNAVITDKANYTTVARRLPAVHRHGLSQRDRRLSIRLRRAHHRRSASRREASNVRGRADHGYHRRPPRTQAHRLGQLRARQARSPSACCGSRPTRASRATPSCPILAPARRRSPTRSSPSSSRGCFGEDPLDIGKHWRRLENLVHYLSPHAVGTVDIALWDIAGKAAGLPVHRLLGTCRDRIPAYFSTAAPPDRGRVRRGSRLLAGSKAGKATRSTRRAARGCTAPRRRSTSTSRPAPPSGKRSAKA